jgi:hypothetical protein
MPPLILVISLVLKFLLDASDTAMLKNFDESTYVDWRNLHRTVASTRYLFSISKSFTNVVSEALPVLAEFRSMFLLLRTILPIYKFAITGRSSVMAKPTCSYSNENCNYFELRGSHVHRHVDNKFLEATQKYVRDVDAANAVWSLITTFQHVVLDSHGCQKWLPLLKHRLLLLSKQSGTRLNLKSFEIRELTCCGFDYPHEFRVEDYSRSPEGDTRLRYYRSISTH